MQRIGVFRMPGRYLTKLQVSNLMLASIVKHLLFRTVSTSKSLDRFDPIFRTATWEGRQELLEQSSLAAPARFTVLNANPNQSYKRMDATIEGCAIFARDKPESVQLYLHMGMEDQR